MKGGTVIQALSKALHQLLWSYSRWIVLAGAIFYCSTGLYKIPGDAVGVLTRFGKVVEPSVQPGLHYALPWPIDQVDIVSIKQVKTVIVSDFGSRYRLTEGGASYTFYKNTDLEPFCITGDNNIVAITLVLKYTIDNPVKYLYGMKSPEVFMERCAANLIVDHLSRQRIDHVLTVGKKQLEFDLQAAMLSRLEHYETGLRLSFLEIKEITPPGKVQQDFDMVINAGLEKKKALNQAQGYKNRVVPQARSEASKIVREAEAYKREKILAAEGEASRFLARFEEYSQNPEAHRDKIYLEFISSLYPRLGEIRVVDMEKSQDSGQDFIAPYLLK